MKDCLYRMSSGSGKATQDSLGILSQEESTSFVDKAKELQKHFDIDIAECTNHECDKAVDCGTGCSAGRPINLVRVGQWRPPDEVGFAGLRKGVLKAFAQMRQVGSQSGHNSRSQSVQTGQGDPFLLPNFEDDELTESQILLITRDITRVHLKKAELPAECQWRLTIVETVWGQLRSRTDITRREMLCQLQRNWPPGHAEFLQYLGEKQTDHGNRTTQKDHGNRKTIV